MAYSFALPPFRSISLPSRLDSTPISIEEELSKLKACELASGFNIENIGAKTIQASLVGLAELYVGVEEIIRSPHTQQTLLHHQDGEVVKEALNVSITLLDTCCGARDMLLQMKDHLHSLQSALRRRGGDSSIKQTIGAYICFRKKMKKDISKHIKELKQVECKAELPSVSTVDHNLSVAVRVLRKLSTTSVAALQSLLSFLSTPAAKRTQITACSLISKFMPIGLVASEGTKKITNEMGSVDDALCSIGGYFQDNDVRDDMHMAQKTLKTLIVSINGIEGELECMYKRLIQYRVSLLNIFTC